MSANKYAWKWALGIGGTIVLACLGFAVWVIAVYLAPIPPPPTPAMPHPNAYDYYVAAAKALGDDQNKSKIRDAATVQTPPAATDYPPPLRKPVYYSPAEKEAILSNNSQVLVELRQGFACEYRHPPVRTLAYDDPLSPNGRTLAYLFVLESQTRAAHGDWKGATESCLDAMRFGRDIPRGGPLIPWLVGVAVQSTGRRQAWEVVGHLNSRDARAAARRIEEMESRHVSLADALEEEKRTCQAGLMEILKHPARQRSPGSAPNQPSGPTPAPLRLMFQGTLRSYTRYMDQLIEQSPLPYPIKRPLPPEPKDWMSRALIPAVRPCRFLAARDHAGNSLLAVYLALRAYRLEHGRYPETLAELTPSYLEKIPDDPFALKGPLRYKRTGAKCVLYSIGPDGKDDGGKPIEQPMKRVRSPHAHPGAPARLLYPAEARFSVMEGSKGDVVAGVNTR